MNFEGALINVALLWLLTTPHEFAHAWVATKLGDDTPRNEGRVTLNPLAHVDWIGTVALPAITSLLGAGFLGWGKAVNTNPSKLRGHNLGLALVALAGPASNVVFALILALISNITISSSPGVSLFAARGVRLSLYLALFNMLPVPPLDGSKLLLAAKVPAVIYRELAQFGFILLIVAMSATSLGYTMSSWSYTAAEWMFSLFQVRA